MNDTCGILACWHVRTHSYALARVRTYPRINLGECTHHAYAHGPLESTPYPTPRCFVFRLGQCSASSAQVASSAYQRHSRIAAAIDERLIICFCRLPIFLSPWFHPPLPNRHLFTYRQREREQEASGERESRKKFITFLHVLASHSSMKLCFTQTFSWAP